MMHNGNLLAGTGSYGGVYRSNDRGNNWSPSGMDGYDMVAVQSRPMDTFLLHRTSGKQKRPFFALTTTEHPGHPSLLFCRNIRTIIRLPLIPLEFYIPVDGRVSIAQPMKENRGISRTWDCQIAIRGICGSLRWYSLFFHLCKRNLSIDRPW